MAAAGTLAARYLNVAYHPDGRVRSPISFDMADADLRANLATLVTPDRIEVEFQRVLYIVATDPNPGPKPDRGPDDSRERKAARGGTAHQS